VKRKISVAIPASIISDTPHLREKTAKIGLIARVAAIFRVNEIIIYADNSRLNQNKDIDLVYTLLSYAETPQYLRKRLFQIKPELKFAGVLPPLRTPHHPLTTEIEDFKIGDFREGATICSSSEGTFVDIGLDRLCLIPQSKLDSNIRVTVKVTQIKDRIEGQIVKRDQVPEYWGFEVNVERRFLGCLLREDRFDLIIATSKIAEAFKDRANELVARWKKAKSVLILFGAPSRGLFEIGRDEGLELNDMVEFVLNTIPNQGTETVRAEEALLATLAIFNLYFGAI
jgi:predicted SPOUT superfamily RNA methylase MTH1